MVPIPLSDLVPLAWALEQGVITHEDRTEWSRLKLTQIPEWLDWFEGQHTWWRTGYGVMALTSAFTGLRFGEAAALRRSRVDLAGSRLEVGEALTEVRGKVTIGPTKTRGSARSAPLPKAVRLILDLYIS